MFSTTRRRLEARRDNFMVPHDPTVIFYPPAAETLNQRDPTIQRVEYERSAGVSGFFDNLPQWLLPVLLGVVVLIIIAMVARKRQD